jgi:hypothetical protein
LLKTVGLQDFEAINVKEAKSVKLLLS